MIFLIKQINYISEAEKKTEIGIQKFTLQHECGHPMNSLINRQTKRPKDRPSLKDAF